MPVERRYGVILATARGGAVMSRSERISIIVAILIGVPTTIFAGIQAWDVLDRRGMVAGALIVVGWVLSVAGYIFVVYLNLRDAHRAKSLSMKLENLKYEHEIQIKHLQSENNQANNKVRELSDNCEREKRIREGLEGKLHTANDTIAAFSQHVADISETKTPLPPLTAPRFIVKHPQGDQQDTLVLTNDGMDAATDVEVGPLIHEERHEITVMPSPFGSISGKASEKRYILTAQESPHAKGSLWAAMRRGAMEPQPVDSVTLKFGDSRGNHFSQKFELTSEVDGSITWKADQVQFA